MPDTLHSPPDFSALIVEGDPFFVQVLSASVTRLYPEPRLWTIGTGSEALAFCAKPPVRGPDLALVDLGLPDLDGLAVIRAIVERFPQMPVMVVSAASEQARVMEAIRAGANGYLLKGDASLSVVRAIRQLLEGIHPISPMLGKHFLALARNAQVAPSQGATEAHLTGKEQELLTLLAEGLTYARAADRMGVAVSTVLSHSRGLFRKLGARSQLQALVKARELGLV